MKWDIECTDQFITWFQVLSDEERAAIGVAIERLEQDGPTLGRPFAATLSSSQLPHLKELRPMYGNIRILFAFGPRRTGIVLLGGDKTGEWNRWYQHSIPEAERLYNVYLAELEEEGQL